MDEKVIKDVILDTVIASLDAQLRAVKRLRGPEEKATKRGMSQVDMVYNILSRSGTELHISEIIRRVEEVNGIRLDRESIASALSKKIKKGDRFLRVGKNTFTLRREVE